MPQLHPRPLAAVTGVGAAHQVAPLLGGAVDLAVGALGVPLRAVGRREARERHAREGRAAREDVGVDAEEDVGHHRARGDAGGEDPLGVEGVVGADPVDHGLDAHRVAAAAVGQRLRGGDVEALAAARHRGVDDDVAVLVGQGGVLGAAVERLRRAGAVVRGHQQRRVRVHIVRHVRVHLEVAGIGAEVRHLGQLPGRQGALLGLGMVRRREREERARHDEHGCRHGDEGAPRQSDRWCHGVFLFWPAASIHRRRSGSRPVGAGRTACGERSPPPVPKVSMKISVRVYTGYIDLCR